MTYSLYGVPSNSVAEVWEEVSPIIKKAVDRTDRYLIEDIYKAVRNRNMQLWVIMDSEIKAAFITEVVCYPQMKVLSCPFVAGVDAASWIHLIKEVEQFAKEQGCSEVEPPGRKGWKKLLPSEYKEYVTIFRKKI